MMKYVQVKKVETAQEMRDFVLLPRRIYGGCPYYVPDLEREVRNTFRPGNAALKQAEVQAFIAYDGEGEAVGRIAGMINRRANEKWHTRTVRFGFIEFIDAPEVSAALLHAVEEWGKNRGMDCVQGPMGLFNFDKAGMLVEDFDQPATMTTIYNPPYYPKHLEAMGFVKAVDWVQISIAVPETVPVKYARVAKYARETFGLTVRKVDRRDIYERGYGMKLFRLLNAAYSPLFGYTDVSEKQIGMYIRQYLPFIDKNLMPIIEDGKGEVIGAAITMGSLSHALQRTGGRLFPWGWFHLFRAMLWRREEKVEMLLIAVHPDYQGFGVNALIFDDLIPVYNRYHFKVAETCPQLEDNMKELSQWKPLNPTYGKRRRCYRKEI